MDLQSGFPKKTLFWKYMIVGLQGMYQEYDLYERLAKDRRFDMSRHLKKDNGQALSSSCDRVSFG